MKWGCRAAARRRNRGFAEKESCLRDVAYADGLTADVWRPEKADRDQLPAVFYVHGGAFVAGDKRDFDGYCERLCSEGYSVINLNYTLSPKAVHPQAVGEILCAVSFFLSQAEQYGLDRERYLLAGDSAGAFLALAAGTVISNPAYLPEFQPHVNFSREGLCGLMLFCGAFSLESALGSGFPFLREYISAYAGQRDLGAYLKSKAYEAADPNRFLTAALPACFLAVGAGDKFLIEAKALSRRLQQVGCRVTLYIEEAPEAAHEFHSYLDRPEAQRCFEGTVDFLSSCTAVKRETNESK